MGKRIRTPVVLLSALLLAILAVSGFTIILLQGQRVVLQEAIRESQAQTIALLGNRVEQVLVGAMRTPFLALKNIPLDTVNVARLGWMKQTFPEVAQVLFLDALLRVRHSFPVASAEKQSRLNRWVVQRLGVEGVQKKVKPFALHPFLETLDGHPELFALQPLNDVDAKEGWLLIRFDLRDLLARRVAPLLRRFEKTQGGAVQLQDADAEWDENAFNWPLNRVLPGWLLSYRPDVQQEEGPLARQSALVLGVAGAVLLAMVMATFSVWRELRREHALVDLRNRFVANVSHELKTPLALIRMYAETLYLGRITDQRRRHQYHRTILRESERLTQMIDTVLDFARLNQGVKLYHLEAMDLGATVSEVLEHYRPGVEERGLRLEARLAPRLPSVAHDRHGITQILVNLMDNAVKYAAGGGVIRVALAGDGDWVDLSVSDAGPGIPAAERAHLRQALHRGMPPVSARGSGLGLALVHQIAAAHHAHFILDTVHGGTGVKATVSFPIHHEESS